jgi:hypothetical protein
MSPDEQKRMERLQLRSLRAEDEVERLRAVLESIASVIDDGAGPRTNVEEFVHNAARAALAKEEA